MTEDKGGGTSLFSDRESQKGAFWHIPSSTALLSQKEILSLLSKKLSFCTPSEGLKWQKPKFAQFENCFSQALCKIGQGRLKKVVPVFF